MSAVKKRTTLLLTRATTDEAQSLGLNLSAIADAAIGDAVGRARREAWAQEHAEALQAQDAWMARNGHPFADVIDSPLIRDGDA